MSTLTPNMLLTLPTPSQTSGPEWANNLNSSLTLIDQHNHTSGRGARIPPAGLSITTDLPFQNHGATQLSHTQFNDNTSLQIPTSVYVFAGDLYYNNAAGQAVAITNGNSVNGAAGNITGLIAPAAVNYDSGTFSFLQDTGGPTSAVVSVGHLSLAGVNAGLSNLITIQPPGSFSTYSLTLPPNPPGAQSVMTMSNSGVVTNAAVDGTLTLTPSLLKVGTIQTSNIANSAVTLPKLAAPNYVVTNSCNQFTVPSSGVATIITNCTTTFNVITSPTLRPIWVSLQYKPGISPFNLLPANIQVGATSVLDIYFDVTGVFSGKFGWTQLSGSGLKSISSASAWIVPTSAGIISVSAYAQLTTGTIAQIQNAALVVYQL